MQEGHWPDRQTKARPTLITMFGLESPQTVRNYAMISSWGKIGDKNQMCETGDKNQMALLRISE